MSQSIPIDEPGEEAAGRPEPASLPLFTGDEGSGQPHRPGRVRSRFRIDDTTSTGLNRIHVVRGRGSGNGHGEDGPEPGVVGTAVSGHHLGEAGGDGIDWGLVAAFRSQASDRLSVALGEDRALDEAAKEQLGRAIILELLQSEAAEAVSAGRPSWSLGQQQAMADAIFNALFGLGRFQPLVDHDTVENIEVYGCDNVLLEHSDGRLEVGPAVAESDEELIEFINFLGSKSGSGRPFSEAHPVLHMRLDGGSRLAATAWVTPRPAIVIRRHRLRDTDMAQLAATGVCSPLQAGLLRAAVKARLNIVVSGAQGAGKTTTVRGLCGEIDPWEKIGTFETEYELFLDELPHKHKRVMAFEARPGSGEVGINGRQAGEITLDDLLADSFRFILGRTIVGEVRGREIMSMIKAMQSTWGSISTTHAANAKTALHKLITCAMEAGPHISEAYAKSAVTGHIDLVVHLDLDVSSTPDGDRRRKRWISEIISVEPGEQGPGYATQHVFRPVTSGPGVANVLPDHLRAVLEAEGFDPLAFEAECDGHGGPVS